MNKVKNRKKIASDLNSSESYDERGISNLFGILATFEGSHKIKTNTPLGRKISKCQPRGLRS